MFLSPNVSFTGRLRASALLSSDSSFAVISSLLSFCSLSTSLRVLDEINFAPEQSIFPLQAHVVSQFLSSGKKSCFGKAEEFHSTKVSQLLAFCHKNGGFRDVITKGFRASGHKSLSFTLP